MFTGIVTDVGTVRAVEKRADGDARLTIATHYETTSIDLGASIACAGVCLTVVGKGPDWVAFDASNETLGRTTLGEREVGDGINLERALRIGDELGGHIVSGHVDGVGEVVAVEPDGDSHRFVFQNPPALSKFIAEKGSVTINGVSLTVNGTASDRFDVNIIPFTSEHTTFGTLAIGDRANIEIDVVARYVARLNEKP